MSVSEKIKAAVAERIQDGELGANTHLVAPPTKFIGIAVVETNVKDARKAEAELPELDASSAKAIVKASDKTLHPDEVARRVLAIQTDTSAKKAALVAKLEEMLPLVLGQKEHYSHVHCLQRTQFPGNDASQRMAVMARLGRLSDAMLLDTTRSVLAGSDGATAGCIYDELATRRDMAREVRAEIHNLLAKIPSDSTKALALVSEYELRTRRARIAAGLATRSTDKIAAGLLARQTAGASK
jgi:hypothetical protein